LSQIAKDFGTSEGALHTWLKKADVEDGHHPGLTDAERVELREAKKRVRLLEHVLPPTCPRWGVHPLRNSVHKCTAG
jgi:transposase-like protein